MIKDLKALENFITCNLGLCYINFPEPFPPWFSLTPVGVTTSDVTERSRGRDHYGTITELLPPQSHGSPIVGGEGSQVNYVTLSVLLVS